MPEPVKRLPITRQTLKMLFGLSGNRCAMPECEELVADKANGTVLGKVAHICAAEEGGPRFDENMSNEDRRSFKNLMLVCGKCHDIIDNKANAERFPPDVLRRYKAEHEARHAERTTEIAPTQPPDSPAVNETILAEVRELRGAFEALQLSGVALAPAAAVPPPDVREATNADDGRIDDEIDGYRDLINEGKPQTAKMLLERCLARLRDLKPGHRFRVEVNIGVCRARLGDISGGAEQILRAVELDPENARAAAFRAFALLLLGRHAEVVDAASAALAAGEGDVALAVRLVQAASQVEGLDDPLSLLPEPMRENADVQAAWIGFLRLRPGERDWRAEATAARLRYPRHEQIIHFAAVADLDAVTSDSAFLSRGFPNDAQRDLLAQAVAVIRPAWEAFLASEDALSDEHAADCCNLAMALLLLGDEAGALSTVREGLRRAPDNQDILLRAAITAVEVENDALADEMISRLEPGTEATLTAFRHNARHERWDRIAGLPDEEVSSLPESERPMIAVVVALARLKVAAVEPDEPALRAILEGAGDPRSRIVCADFFRKFGHDRLADEAVAAAVASVGEDDSHASRRMVAAGAARYRNWSAITRLLDGYVSLEADSPDLRLLATSFANTLPVTRRAKRFFEELAPDLAASARYARLGGLVFYNSGDLDAAEEWLRRARAADPTNATTLAALIGVLRRRNQPRAAARLVQDCDTGQVKGEPVEVMQIARELLHAGRARDGLALAYDIVRSCHDDPEVGPLYFGLLMGSRASRAIPKTPAVGLDAWVRIVNEDGEEQAFVIEEGGSGRDVVSPDHALARGAMGRQVGETFEVERPLGPPTVWTVREIAHKYVYALRDVADNYEHRFPDARGIVRVTMKDGDPSLVFDQVRALAKANERIADLYLKNSFPLAFVAEAAKGDPVSFAAYIRSRGGRIKVCAGANEEREAAFALIQRHGRRGAALDLYTAFVCAHLEIFEPLEAVLGPLSVPRSALDALLAMIHKEDDDLGARSLSIAYVNGAFVGHETTREEIHERRRMLDGIRTAVERACEILPVAAPDAMSEDARKILDLFGNDALDAAFVAAETGAILLSEDFSFRLLVGETCGVPGTWLQAALLESLRLGPMSENAYIDAMVGLSKLGHGFATLSAAVLSGAMADGADLAGLETLATNLGGPGMEPVSHAAVAGAFLSSLWASGETWHRKGRATHLMLNALTRDRKPWQACQIAGLLLTAVGSEPQCEAYFRVWTALRSLPWEAVVVARERWLRHLRDAAQ